MRVGEIKGIKTLLKNLNRFGDEGRERIADVTEAVAREIESDAKIFAPVDTGKLRQSIKAIELDKLSWSVRANATNLAPYAPYMEFGTGGLVEVPEELKDIAIQFKGKGVRKIDLRPRPYLYPAFVQGRTQYIKDLKAELKDLIRGLKGSA